MSHRALTPELHSYLVLAVNRLHDAQCRDPRWISELARLTAKPAEERTRRENAIIASELIQERLYVEALGLADALLEEDTDPPSAAAAAGAL